MSEKVALANRIQEYVALQSKLRQYHSKMADKRISGTTREIIAKAVGTSFLTLKRAYEIVTQAEKNPEHADLVDIKWTQALPEHIKSYKSVLRNQKQIQPLLPIVYLPNGKKKELHHISSNHFKSGSVFAWIASNQMLDDNTDMLIMRRANFVFVFSNKEPEKFSKALNDLIQKVEI